MAPELEVLDRHGFTSTVYLLPGSPRRACKSFDGEHIKTHFPVEKEAYERFTAAGHPSSILKYYGTHHKLPAALILELAENKSLWDFLETRKRTVRDPHPEPKLIYRLAWQAAEGLAFAHSLGVYNSDIHPINFFLTANLDLKVGDWAGASIDGSISHSSYRLRYRIINSLGRDGPSTYGISAATEIFAFGTAIFFMVVLHEPWPELLEPGDDEEIKRRIQKREFPDTRQLPVLGEIISLCWKVEFASMDQVKEAIETERDRALYGQGGDTASGAGGGHTNEGSNARPEMSAS